jgi:hypothetical protein
MALDKICNQFCILPAPCIHSSPYRCSALTIIEDPVIVCELDSIEFSSGIRSIKILRWYRAKHNDFFFLVVLVCRNPRQGPEEYGSTAGFILLIEGILGNGN